MIVRIVVVVVVTVTVQLIDGKDVQINLTGFLEQHTPQ